MANEEEKKTGQPTKYNTEHNKLVYKLALLGATTKEIADCLNVSDRTIENWAKKYPEFEEQLRKGKTEADAKVSYALFKNATGFTKMVEEPRQVGKNVEILKYKKFFRGDTRAQTMWLWNRQKDKWREKQAPTEEEIKDNAIEITIKKANNE